MSSWSPLSRSSPSDGHIRTTFSTPRRLWRAWTRRSPKGSAWALPWRVGHDARLVRWLLVVLLVIVAGLVLIIRSGDRRLVDSARGTDGSPQFVDPLRGRVGN